LSRDLQLPPTSTKLAAVRVALASPSGDDEWSAYSAALGRKFLRLDEFLKPAPAPVLSPSLQVAEHKAQSPNAAAAAASAPESAAKPKPEPSLLRKLFS